MKSITKIVLFRNFTAHDFVGQWDSVSETIKAGDKRHMELWRALHYGKHLVNDELNRKGLSQYCSPKFPEQVPQFMDLLKQCVIDDEQIEVHTSSAVEEMANLNQPTVEDKEPAPKSKSKKTPKKTDEEVFEGLEE